MEVLANDGDGNGDALEIIGVTTPAKGGSAVLDDNGTPSDPSDDRIVYTPPAEFSGDDTFTYTISDGRGGTSTATVTVSVTRVLAAINTDPAYTDDGTNTLQKVPVGDRLTPLQATDPDSDPLTYTAIEGSLPPGVTLNPDGTFGGTPTTPGTSTVRVRVCDDFNPPGCDETVLVIVVPDEGPDVLGASITGNPGTLGAPEVGGTTIPVTGTQPGGPLALGWALVAMGVLTRWAIRLTGAVDRPKTGPY
jgi:hypothetical protein